MTGPSVLRYRAILQQYGLKRCTFRAWYDFRRKRGWLLSRFPAWEWHERPLEDWLVSTCPASTDAYFHWRRQHSPAFFFKAGDPPRPPAGWTLDAVSRADGILEGRFPYFHRQTAELSYPEPRWFLNPFTGGTTDARTHWLDRADFEPSLGDIKFIWEPSRFIWAYDLVRAFATTGDDRYVEAFWRLTGSWRTANPPQRGPNWQCGQEVAIRVLALTFALHAFWSHPSTTPSRVVELVTLLAASAERIAANIDYARAQMGNHATTEAAALVTIGRMFPELSQAQAWLALGQRVLAAESRDFHWPDGSYVQHSMNYHRLMLDAYLWVGALGTHHGDPLPSSQLDRLDASWRFLYQMQDAETGRVPNYGPNDGAQILPLHGCGYLDHRPIVDACCVLTRRHACFGEGPWSEKSRWLFGNDPSHASGASGVPARRGEHFARGGYDTFRAGDCWGMVRCHTYRTRPNQADMLHIDLWWRGINICRDSGTYTYFDPQTGWERYFVSTAAHNTVRIAGVDQMIKGARFQWHSLLKARRHLRQDIGGLEIWSGEHRGYRRLPSRAIHRRTIIRCHDACWIVVDDIAGQGHESIELFWHLVDAPLERSLDGWRVETKQGPVMIAFAADAPFDLSSSRGVDSTIRAGWDSLHYGERNAAPTVMASVSSALPVRLITHIAFTADLVVTASKSLQSYRYRCDGIEGEIALARPGTRPCPVESIAHGGERWQATN